MDYKNSLILLVLFNFIISITVSAVEFSAFWYKLPPGSHHLEPALFLSQELFMKLQATGFTEGMPAKIIHNKKIMEMRIYSSLRHGTTFSTNHQTGTKLGFKSGINQFKVELLPIMEQHLPFRPLHPYVDVYNGDTLNWKGFALGAPHGDCDWFTGNIARELNKISKIPTIASYGCRFPYRGIWYDCNRPLMKNPAFLGGIRGIGVFNYRVWNTSAAQIYTNYQIEIFKMTKLKHLTFFTSLHGHDLMVRLANGKMVSKNVIEGIGIGFSRNQLREIKKFYQKEIKKYFRKPPPLYFGNLPEDQSFFVHGKKVYFLYSAAGTRLYGSLRRELIDYGLHLETPNSLRSTKEKQKKFALFLTDLYAFIKNMPLAKHANVEQINFSPIIMRKKELIAHGTFKMGSKAPNAWSNEKPQHQVYLDDYYIDKYEVTNQQYANFLNKLWKKHLITITQGIVYEKEGGKHLLCKLRAATSFTHIYFLNNKFQVIQGKENHPVVHVSYYGASKFAHFYAEELPTEAQWEKAASWDPQLEKKYKYATGQNRILGLANIEDSNDPFEANPIATSPVGFFQTPNFYGIEDMSGNVWEWTKDYYKDSIYQQHKEQLIHNPQGPNTGTMHTIRGGSWDFEYIAARTTMRLSVAPNFTAANIGFRCVTPPSLFQSKIK